MNEQPEPNPWVVRTDFSDTPACGQICKQIGAPQGDDKFLAYVAYVDDDRFQDHDPQDVVLSLPDTYKPMFCFVVDRECVRNREHPILVIGFYPSDNDSFDRLPRDTPLSEIATFRALPSQIQSIENNLSIANMDYTEFAAAVDSDGVFRGFSR